METGKILIAEDSGNYLVKLVGYVRLTLCASLNNYIENIFKLKEDSDRPASAKHVLIDLCDTEGLDSTTLGLLAKLALYCQREFKLKPLLFCASPGILRELEVMAIDSYFEIIQEPCNKESFSQENMQELPQVDSKQEAVRDQILAAHRLLIELNPACEEDFSDLIQSLEEADCRG